MQKELHVQKDYATVGEEIGAELGAEFITKFQESYPNETKWFFMGKNILGEILAQPGCAGIRFYNGLNESGNKTLVYVGVDHFGNDIITRTVVEANGSTSVTNGLVADRNNDSFDIFHPSTWFNW